MVLRLLFALLFLALSLPLSFADSDSESAVVEADASVISGDIIARVVIRGAQRIDERTILDYLEFEPGDIYTARLADDSVKALYSTGLFANIEISREGSAIIVRVQENPVINRLSFEGNERIDDGILQSETGLGQRTVYSRSRVQGAVRRILDIYRRRGRYAVTVEPHLIRRDQNRVDLVFEIDEGQLSKVTRIFFNGNRFFSDSDLKDEISSREYNRLNFLAVGDTYDPDRVNFDKQLLRSHYFRYGFIDYSLASAVGELLEDRSGFYITFALQEGERYRVGEITASSAIPEVLPEMVLSRISMGSGSWYDQDIVDGTRAELNDYLGGLGYAFTNIDVALSRRVDDSGAAVVDLHFDIRESSRIFVERIDIHGNVRTVDSVVRREFELVEGDPYNRNKINLSRRNLERLGYFGKVEVRERPGSAEDRAILEVDVEEVSTGFINIGVGYSTLDGALFAISLRETNLLGRAHEVEISYSNSQRKDEFILGYKRPYFLGYKIRAGIEFFNRQEEQIDNQYKTEETGLTLSATYPLAPYFSQGLTYTLSDQKRTVSRTATTTGSVRTGVLSSLGQTLRYDTRNSIAYPTSGYYVTLANNLAGLGGDFHYFRTVLRGAYYSHIGRSDWNWLIGGEVGNILGWNGKDVARGDRFFLGGSNLRGFRSYGAGSRSSRAGFALGGTNIATATAELRRPILLESFGTTGSIFMDAGWVNGIEDDARTYPTTLVKDSSIRASAGLGLRIITPIGPMRFDFAWPLKKEDYDRDQVFQFSFRGRF